MPKKVRFPLKLADGTQARSLEELKEHFDLESVLEHYKSGKLLTWLRDRYIEAEADAVELLDETAPDFQQRLCSVFGVEHNGADVDLEVIERRQERLARLRQFTDEDEYIQNIDSVAFDQEELADLLDEDCEKIYLCGEKFTVPVSMRNKTYIGINAPAVQISGGIGSDWTERNIRFVGCEVDGLETATEREKITDDDTTAFDQEKQTILAECDEILKIVDSWKDLTCFIGALIFDTSCCDMDNIVESLDKRVSKTQCELQAREAVRKIYDEASKLFSVCSSKGLSARAYKSVIDRIEDNFAQIEHHIRLMGSTSMIEEEIKYLKGYLDIEKAKSDLMAALDEELQDDYYRLYNFNYFLERVEIESDDMEVESGFWRILEAAAASYTFNAIEPYIEITDDAKKYAEVYEKNANEIIQNILSKKYANRIREIIVEIRRKLSGSRRG